MVDTSYRFLDNWQTEIISGEYVIKERRDETLDGQIVLMPPSSNYWHCMVTMRITLIFDDFFKGTRNEVFRGCYLHLTESDIFIPDVQVVTDPSMVKENWIHGAPDLVAEVILPLSAKNDRGYKKSVYEKCGVKEYWIVTVENRTI